MTTITMRDGAQVFYKDLGPRDARPIMFHHGWPLSADDWDGQLPFFLHAGYRVIAHDRRAHGRSSQTTDGHDMDSYAADVSELVARLDLRDAVHVGHSTGGGEVARYVARAEPGRVGAAVLIGAVTPQLAQSAANPDGVPRAVFDGLRAALAANRAQLYRDVAGGPFYGFDRDGATADAALVDDWVRQAMMGGAEGHSRCIAAFAETDFTRDLAAIDVPALVLHGTDDRLVPFVTTALRTVELLGRGSLKAYDGLSHGLHTTHPEIVNADILAFLQG